MSIFSSINVDLVDIKTLLANDIVMTDVNSSSIVSADNSMKIDFKNKEIFIQ